MPVILLHDVNAVAKAPFETTSLRKNKTKQINKCKENKDKKVYTTMPIIREFFSRKTWFIAENQVFRLENLSKTWYIGR